MWSSLALSFVLAIGVQSRPMLGRHARAIESRNAVNETYDFVIAGGGIAGLTVADRLSENPDGALFGFDLSFGAEICLTSSHSFSFGH